MQNSPECLCISIAARAWLDASVCSCVGEYFPYWITSFLAYWTHLAVLGKNKLYVFSHQIRQWYVYGILLDVLSKVWCESDELEVLLHNCFLWNIIMVGLMCDSCYVFGNNYQRFSVFSCCVFLHDKTFTKLFNSLLMR